MDLKLYVDRLSQPSRAILLFCMVNGIEFEEVGIKVAKMEHRTPEFAETNPMKQVPAIVHGDFKLFESHAILIYLASTFSGVADHWYPSDVCRRAKIHSVLDWHHNNLRRGSYGYIFKSGVAHMFGLPLDLKAAAEDKKLQSASLAMIESFWLQEDKPFLLGNSHPSIADLALVCEVMHIECLEEEDRESILGPRKRILKWIEDVKNATAPYFDELHSVMLFAREKFKELKVQVEKQTMSNIGINPINLLKCETIKRYC